MAGHYPTIMYLNDTIAVKKGSGSARQSLASQMEKAHADNTIIRREPEQHVRYAQHVNGRRRTAVGHFAKTAYGEHSHIKNDAEQKARAT